MGNVKNSDLHAVRIIVVVPNRYHTPLPSTQEERDALFQGDKRMRRQAKGYTNHVGEIWKILGEFPVGDARGGGAGAEDPDGEPDTSWLARIPANTPHFIQGIDKRGMTIYTEQTWRHVSPGKTVANCGGCHAHSVEGISMESKKADASGYKPWDLVSVTPVLVPGTGGGPAAYRLHVRMRPTKRGHWNNEAEPLRAWLEVSEGWIATRMFAEAGSAKAATSDEERVLEFDVRADKDAKPGKLQVHAFYNVCTEKDATCLYRRRDLEVDLPLKK